MKFFIITLVLLFSVGVFCATWTHDGIRRVDEMIETLSAAQEKDGTVPQNAMGTVEKLEKQWAKNEFYISMLLPHHHLDEVKEKLISLKAYASTEEFADWTEAKLVLLEELEHIRALIRISSDNVL